MDFFIKQALSISSYYITSIASVRLNSNIYLTENEIFPNILLIRSAMPSFYLSK